MLSDGRIHHRHVLGIRIPGTKEASNYGASFGEFSRIDSFVERHLRGGKKRQENKYEGRISAPRVSSPAEAGATASRTASAPVGSILSINRASGHQHRTSTKISCRSEEASKTK